MRRILVSNMVTLDGYFAGPNGEIDWHRVDKEFNSYADKMLHSVDTLLFGRMTYQLMAGYWPTQAATTDDPIIAGQMNSLQKIVFSTTLKQADWQNTKLISDNIVEEMVKLKQLPGKDMVIFGSGSIVSAFSKHGLIDEYRIIINPVVLGSGKPLFSNIKMNLELITTKTFRSGNILLYYQPVRK